MSRFPHPASVMKTRQLTAFIFAQLRLNSVVCAGVVDASDWLQYHAPVYLFPLVPHRGISYVLCVGLGTEFHTCSSQCRTHHYLPTQAANTVCRSAVGAAFPLFVSQMCVSCSRFSQSHSSLEHPLRFARLGINWALTLIGGIALLLAPLPFLFYYYGAIIRDGSFFAPCIDLRIKEQVEQEVRDALEKEKGMTV